MVSEGKSFNCFLVSALSLVLTVGTALWAYGASTSAPATSARASLGEDYVIQVDDILTIDDGKPHSELSATRTYKVSNDGTIKLIHIGRIKAAGLTKRQLEDTIEKLYDPKYFKNLFITIDVVSNTFDVWGEVRNPGIKNLVGEMTILKAIASAGGFTDYAKESKVIVIRKTGSKFTRLTVDCDAILEGKAEDIIIEPKDVIWVQRKLF